jgi:hypothetical protein
VKLATSLATVFVLCLCTAAFAAPQSTSNVGMDLDELIALKNANVTGINNPQPQVGGEDIGSAVAIPALPYNDGGNTCAYIDDYDEVCPFTGSTAPDVVYSYTPGANASIDISLCTSLYDTKVFVYENAATPGSPYACNDDACGDDGFKSELVGVPVTAGNTYYIVVDGYFGACGDYSMDVTENVPCVVECPPMSVLEGEVDCFEGYDDNYNGGCNSTPNVFTDIPCDLDGAQTVCGTYGGFFHPQSGFNYRDTDWYQILPEGNTDGVTVCVTGQYDTLSGYINGALGCGAPSFVESQITGPCDTACFNIPGGNYWFFVATSGFGVDAGACGGAYTITLDSYVCTPVSVEAASWGQIKNDYR